MKAPARASRSLLKPRAALLAAVLSFVGLSAPPFAQTAEAALTSSEKAQLRDLVASAKIDSAGRVRTLVARTDHTETESVAALASAVAPVAWTAERSALLKEVLFGGASLPSRPLLAVAVVRAALARADEIYQKHGSSLDREPQAAAELAAIYAFVDGEVANAGKPTVAAHDPHAGIPPASYEAASKALRDHVDQHARWLKGDGPVAESVGRVRAQAQILLLDMLPDGLTRRVDAADRLGLSGARRQMLIEWGVLLADAGTLDDAKALRVREVLGRLPGARIDLALLYAAKEPSATRQTGPLRARGYVAFVGAGDASSYPFADDVAQGSYDPATSAIALDLSILAARRALDNRSGLRTQAERDAVAAQVAARGDAAKLFGRPRGPGIDQAVGAAIHLLMLDAPRALDLAFARHVDGRPESAALLSDALGALSVFAPAIADKAVAGQQLELGKPEGVARATAVHLAPNGVATSVTLDGHAWKLDRPPSAFPVVSVTRDGAPVTLGQLPTARIPMRTGMSWQASGYVFTKMRGTPRAGIAPGDESGTGPTVAMTGIAPRGYDAIATAAPADDFTLEGDLSVKGGAGGIALRATEGRDSVRGAVLVITPGGRTVLATVDDAGKEVLLAGPIEPSPTTPVHVRIVVRGAAIEASVGTSTLKGVLPKTLARGEVALVAKRGANVEVAKLMIKK